MRFCELMVIKLEILLEHFAPKNKFNILFNNGKTSNTKVKYPGAHVFKPVKGLNNKAPTVV